MAHSSAGSHPYDFARSTPELNTTSVSKRDAAATGGEDHYSTWPVDGVLKTGLKIQAT